LGRTGIYEILIIDDAIRDLIMRGASALQIRKVAVNSGMTTLFGDGLDKVNQGFTTLSEVLRVTQQ